jgi:ParB-like chromosome segregation protein Spo0J
MNTVTSTHIGRIIVDPSLQPRVGGLDADHVRALQEAPEGWPPLLVVQRDGRYLLVDGFHRFAAAQNLGLETVRVEVEAVPADGDLHALAFRANAAHGRPLSLADRRAFAERLLRAQPRLADREIGRRCGLSSNTVGAVRERLEAAAQIEQTTERVGRGGYSYTVGTNEEKRQPGELPEASFEESVGEAVGGLFTSAERKRQRRFVRYLERLAVALDDQYDLKGWETHEEAARACRLVLGIERATELARELGDGASNVLQVAVALGYDDDADGSA